MPAALTRIVGCGYPFGGGINRDIFMGIALPHGG